MDTPGSALLTSWKDGRRPSGLELKPGEMRDFVFFVKAKLHPDSSQEQ